MDEKKYATKVNKSGALLHDTKTILSYWDLSKSIKENNEYMINENVLNKLSRVQIKNISLYFNQRYCNDESVLKSLVYFAQNGFPSQSLDRLLYFFAMRSDLFLHDVVIDIIYPYYIDGKYEIYKDDIFNRIQKWVNDGLTTKSWSYSTTKRVTEGISSTLRDYGILKGKQKKRIEPTFLPNDAFSFIALYLSNQGLSGKQNLNSIEWKLFLMDPFSVERFFMDSQQDNLLHYQAAGDVIRIEFPYQKLEEYAQYVIEK